MKFNDWNKNLENGNLWEKKLYEKLSRLLLTINAQIIDYAENPTWQKKGIDFLLSIGQRTVEQKTRDYQYYWHKDILLETISVIENNTPGWFYSTEADAVAYVWKNKEETDIIDGYFIFITKELRQWINDNEHSFNHIKVHSNNYSSQWSTMNISVPISLFPRENLMQINFVPKIKITKQTKLNIHGEYRNL